jgi:uncharacterized membrane protein (DUF106 family)
MKKILTTLIGTSLLAGALFASGNMNMMDQSKMSKTQKECQSMMKSQKSMHNADNKQISQSGLNLLEKRYSQEDLTAGG